MSSQKKRDKAEAKRLKKAAKAEIKARKRGLEAEGNRDSNDRATHDDRSHRLTVRRPGDSSVAVRYAEFVRGCLYVVTGSSIVVALILGQRGAIISLNDLIENLFAANAGKVVLGLIGIALLLYGFKHLRLIK